MKNLIYLLLLFSTFNFGQVINSVLLTKTIYSRGNITIYFTITYKGIIDCNDNPKGGLKRYQVKFYGKNESKNVGKFIASRIGFEDNVDEFKSECSSTYLLFGSSPGFEEFGTLVPNENAVGIRNVYMTQNSNKIPVVSYNLYPSGISGQSESMEVGNSMLNLTSINKCSTGSTDVQSGATSSNSNQAIKNKPIQSVSKKISAKDLENAIDISFLDKIKIFKDFFIQNGYVPTHEGDGDYTGYGLVYRDFAIQFYYESDDEENPYNTNGIGTSIISMNFESINTLNKVANLLTNYSNAKDVDTGRKKISLLGK